MVKTKPSHTPHPNNVRRTYNTGSPFQVFFTTFFLQVLPLHRMRTRTISRAVYETHDGAPLDKTIVDNIKQFQVPILDHSYRCHFSCIIMMIMICNEKITSNRSLEEVLQCKKYRATEHILCFFPKNSQYFATSPSPALVCYWLYSKCPANKSDCSLRSQIR